MNTKLHKNSMGIANMIADDLHYAGFRTKVENSNCVSVSLSNRKPNVMEIETAMEKEYDTSVFTFRSTNNEVLVMW